MGHSRTLLRKRTKDRVVFPEGVVYADRPARAQRIKPGTPHRRVVSVPHPDPRVDHSFHATKGHRFVRMPI